MPYEPAQVRLFQMVAHGKVHKPGLSAGKAKKMLAEAGQSHNNGHSAAKRLSK